MAKVTPEEYAEKWNRRIKAATEDMRKGVSRVTEAPTEKAAAKAEKMKAHLIEAIDSGKWAERLKSVSLEQWKDAMINKGIGRVAAGADAAKAKQVEFAKQLLSAVEAARAKLEGMPDLTIEDSINRVATYIREMSKFKKK